MARRGIPYYERLRRLRQNPRAGYLFACACVVVSTVIQWSLRDFLAVESFGVFYLAVIISTLVGGAGPGALATVLSGAAETYFFLPPPLSLTLYKGGPLSLTLFFVVAALDVILISVMNRAVDALWTQRENVRRAVESAPIGVVAVNTDGVITLVNAATEALFGYGRDELLGKRIELLVPDGLRESTRACAPVSPDSRRREPWARAKISAAAARTAASFQSRSRSIRSSVRAGAACSPRSST